jgi:hypothetical protein
MKNVFQIKAVHNNDGYFLIRKQHVISKTITIQ